MLTEADQAAIREREKSYEDLWSMILHTMVEVLDGSNDQETKKAALVVLGKMSDRLPRPAYGPIVGTGWKEQY